MNNKERYQRTFSKVHTSRNYLTEVTEMNRKTGFHFSRTVLACLIMALLFGTSAAAYAADVGGIQRTVQVWIHGDQTNAVLDVGDGKYSLTYNDSEGKEVRQQGGGVVINADGTESPVSEEDMIEYLNSPDVEYFKDGKVLVYYFDQVLDITDKFENGLCYVKLIHDGSPLYMTVKYQNGYSTSPRSYPDPARFNISPAGEPF